jgi:hypothetical protein
MHASRRSGVERDMAIGTSVFLTALGLILALAVNVHVPGVDVHTIGWILTLVGVVGLVWTLLLWNRARTIVREGPGLRPTSVDQETTVLRERPVVRDERIIREEPPRY